MPSSPLPTKLAIDVRDLRIAKTGARTYLKAIIDNWAKVSSIELVSIDTNIPVYTGKNKIFKLIEHVRFQLWKQFLLPFKAKQKGCTHLLCTDFFLPYYKQGLITITVLHDAFFWQSPEHYNTIWLYLFHKLAVPAAKKADAIIVPSQYVKNTLLSLEPFDANKMHVVYEAANTNISNKSNAENTITCKPYFFHLGVLERRKNLPFLIEAFAIVHKKHPSYHLVLAGNTPTKEKLDDSKAIKASISYYGLSDVVHLIGYLSGESIQNYYQNAFAYVLPSMNEGFGLPLLEAFSNCIPVICSNAGALPEIAGGAAIMVDCMNTNQTNNAAVLAATMNQLIEEPAKRVELIRLGAERNNQFNWEHTAKQISDLIQFR